METLGDIYGESEKKNVLNIHAPNQTKMIRFNKKIFMTKFRKDIMKSQNLETNLIEIEIMKTGTILKFRGTTV